MAHYAPIFEEKVKRAIRDALAIDNIITNNQLVEHLEKKFNHSFHRNYISRLREKVEKGMWNEVDHAKINQRIAVLRERHRIATERLLRVLYWTKETATDGMLAPLPGDQVEAARQLVTLDIELLKVEVAAHVYDSETQGAQAIVHYKPVPEHLKKEILDRYMKWGVLEKGTVEHMLYAPIIATTTSKN